MLLGVCVCLGEGVCRGGGLAPLRVWNWRWHPDNSSANPAALPARQLNFQNLRQGRLPHATRTALRLHSVQWKCNNNNNNNINSDIQRNNPGGKQCGAFEDQRAETLRKKAFDFSSMEPGILGCRPVTGKDEIPTAQSSTEEAKRS